MFNSKQAIAIGIIALLFVVSGYVETSLGAEPSIVNRPRGSFSINEGQGQPSRPASRVGKTVQSFIGLVPASFNPFATDSGIGSLIKRPDPFYLGLLFGQQVGFDFSYRSRLKQNTASIRPADVSSLGQVCGTGPGDAYWVGYPRPGNVENPQPFQVIHDPLDCSCRCDETITCPRRESPFFHTSFGGNFPFPVSCQACFPTQIRKHDVAVGTNHGSHRGYSISFPNDPGYQQCLRESIQSFAASGPGGSPVGPDNFGL